MKKCPKCGSKNITKRRLRTEIDPSDPSTYAVSESEEDWDVEYWCIMCKDCGHVLDEGVGQPGYRD